MNVCSNICDVFTFAWRAVDGDHLAALVVGEHVRRRGRGGGHRLVEHRGGSGRQVAAFAHTAAVDLFVDDEMVRGDLERMLELHDHLVGDVIEQAHFLIEAANRQQLAARRPAQRLDAQRPLARRELVHALAVHVVDEHLELASDVTR